MSELDISEPHIPCEEHQYTHIIRATQERRVIDYYILDAETQSSLIEHRALPEALTITSNDHIPKFVILDVNRLLSDGQKQLRNNNKFHAPCPCENV